MVRVIQLSRSGQASSWLSTKMISQDLRVFAIAQLWGVGRPRAAQSFNAGASALRQSLIGVRHAKCNAFLLARYESAGGALLYRSAHLQQPKNKRFISIIILKNFYLSKINRLYFRCERCVSDSDTLLSLSLNVRAKRKPWRGVLFKGFGVLCTLATA